MIQYYSDARLMADFSLYKKQNNITKNGKIPESSRICSYRNGLKGYFSNIMLERNSPVPCVHFIFMLIIYSY